MSSIRQDNNDLQRYLQRPPSNSSRPKAQGFSKKKLSVMSPPNNSQQRYKNIQMLQSKIETLKQEPMHDYMYQKQKILQSTEKLVSLQKQKRNRPRPLKLGNDQFILENNYLQGSAQTGKYTVISPLAEIQKEKQSPSHISEEYLRNKLEFFNKRLKDSCADQPPSREVQKQQILRTQESLQKDHSRFDINQYSSGNLQKLIRESRGQNNGPQYFKNSRNSTNPPINYDLNGRKSKSKQMRTQQVKFQDTGELIENHYQKLQQSYNEIFKSQNDFRNNLKNQQIINNHRQSSQELKYRRNRQTEVASSLPDIKSQRKILQHSTSNDNNQSQSNNQQHANGQNNNNFQNNINNSIILLQAPPIGFLSPQAQMNDNFQLFHQMEEPRGGRGNSREVRSNPRKSKQRTNNHSPFNEETEDFATHDQFRTKKSMSPDIQNRDHKLTNQRYVGRRRSHANFSGNSNNMRSISADKLSSNDPESIERQNNQMLMQILYNNLKKKQTRLNPKKKQQKYAPSSSYDHQITTHSASSKGFAILSNRNQTPLEKKMVSPSSKEESEGVPNFSSYVKNKVIMSEVSQKSKSPKDTKNEQTNNKNDNTRNKVSFPHELVAVDNTKNLNKAIQMLNNEEKKVQEASQKIEQLFKENKIFNDVNCEQITSTMMQLLAKEKKNTPKPVKKWAPIKRRIRKDAYLSQQDVQSQNLSSKSRDGSQKTSKTPVKKSEKKPKNEDLPKKSKQTQNEEIPKKPKLSQNEESLKKTKLTLNDETPKKPKQVFKEDSPKKPLQSQKKIDLVTKRNSIKIKVSDHRVTDSSPQPPLLAMKPKNLADKRKSTSAKGQSFPKKQSSGTQSETNTMKTAQFAVLESCKLVPDNSSPQTQIMSHSSKSEFNLNLENMNSNSELKMMPPDVGAFTNIKEESRNNISSQTNSCQAQYELQEDIDEEQVKQMLQQSQQFKIQQPEQSLQLQQSQKSLEIKEPEKSLEVQQPEKSLEVEQPVQKQLEKPRVTSAVLEIVQEESSEQKIDYQFEIKQSIKVEELPEQVVLQESIEKPETVQVSIEKPETVQGSIEIPEPPVAQEIPKIDEEPTPTKVQKEATPIKVKEEPTSIKVELETTSIQVKEETKPIKVKEASKNSEPIEIQQPSKKIEILEALKVQDTPKVIKKPEPVKIHIKPKEAPQQSSKISTPLVVIEEQQEPLDTVKTEEPLIQTKKLRKTPTPTKSKSKSKSPIPKKLDKFSQFLVDQIENAKIDNKPMKQNQNPVSLNFNSEDLQKPIEKFKLSLSLPKQHKFFMKDILFRNNRQLTQRAQPEYQSPIQEKDVDYVKTTNFKQYDIKKQNKNIFTNKKSVNQHILDGIVNYSKIAQETKMYEKNKLLMDEIYNQAKTNYHLKLRKIQTEKKLMSLSLGKLMIGKNQNVSTQEREAMEVELVNKDLKNECQRINNSLTLFKLDYESYKQRFAEEINSENQLNSPHSQDTNQQESQRLSTTRKSSTNKFQKRQSFVENKDSNQKNDSSPLPKIDNDGFQEALVGLSGRSNISRNVQDSPCDNRSGRYSPYSEIEIKSFVLSGDAKSNFQYLYSDSMRSCVSYSSHSKRFLLTYILTQKDIQHYEDEVSLQLQLKKFLSMGCYDETSEYHCHKHQYGLMRKVTTGIGKQYSMKEAGRILKYYQYVSDKMNVEELMRMYFEEQFSIQYPGRDPYKKDEYQRTLSQSSSEGDSQLLGSTISSFSSFSSYSIESDAKDFYPPLQLQNIQKRDSIQDMFQYAQISQEMHPEISPFKSAKETYIAKEIYIDEGEILDEQSSQSHSRGIVNIKSVISLNTNTYQDSIQDNSDDHRYQQLKGFDSAPNDSIRYLTKFGESSRINNSVELVEQPPHIDKPFFFNEQSLAIKKFEKVKEFELNQTLDQYDIKSVNLFLNKINEIWMNKAKKNMSLLKKNVTQQELTKVQNKFRKLVRKLQKQKYSETSNLKVINKFKLTNLINEMIFATQDYDEWLNRRIKGYDSRPIKQKSKQLEEWNNQNFWSGNMQLLKKFLQKNQIKIQQDNDSISSDCDGEEYNNTDCIQMMHEGINPNLLLKNVIKDKNMQYEIFLIMSQTKLQKIKNKITNDKTIAIQDRIAMIDQRFKWIQNQARIKYIKARGVDQCPEEIVDLLHKSEHSSEFSSDDSVEQTAKYFFIEDLELQATKRKYNLDTNRKRNQNQRVSQDGVKQNNFFISIEKRNYSFGFRYGNKKKSKSVIKKEPDSRISSSPSHTPIKIISFDSPKEAGHVRLLNGIALSLDDKDNILNKYGNTLNFNQKAKALKDISRIQGYYDFVKNHIKNKSKQDKIIIKYKRKQTLKEHMIDQDNQTALKQFLTHKISRIVHAKKNKKAISYNITTSTIKRYTNPFEMSRFIKTENINLRNIMAVLQKKQDQKKEKQIHIKSKKFYTADSNQADGVEDFLKSPDYKQGNKCDNFVFKCKLQSIGDFADLKRLENEVQLSNQYPKDVLQYKNIIEPDSGYPIYMLFEVLHVARKNIQDVKEDQLRALEMIKNLTEFNEFGSPRKSENFNNLVEKFKQNNQSSVNNFEL